MSEFDRTSRNKVKRLPARGSYDRDTIYSIIDDAIVCHVAFVQDGQPFIIPTLHARDGDTLLLHGASTSRLLAQAAAGVELCVAITHVDGIVLARSIFHHSINYRSVVLFGQGMLIDEEAAKVRTLERFSERLLPGRWAEVRPPNAVELKATAVIAVAIESASAKVRSGPPKDDAEDLTLPVWAGVLPIHSALGEPMPAPELTAEISLPDSLRAYQARHMRG